MRRTLLALPILLLACPKTPLDPSGSMSGFDPTSPATSDAEPPPPPPPATSDAEPPPPPPPATSDAEPPPPTLQCPGETQCPCVDGCPDGLTCGPTNACTKPCRDSSDCTSGVSGEACIAGLCGVPCAPEVEDGGCGPAGMPGSGCFTIGPTEHYCGYSRT